MSEGDFTPEAVSPREIQRGPDGLYRWACPVELDYVRGNLRRVLRNFALGALVFAALGVIPALFTRSWRPLLLAAAYAGGFVALLLAVSLPMYLFVRHPKTRYEMSGDYVAQPSGKGTTYFYFKDIKHLTIYPHSLELRDRLVRMRVFVPEADYSFVLQYIKARVPAGADIRYE